MKKLVLIFLMSLSWSAFGNQVHVVAPGESLADIAETYYGSRYDWPYISRTNADKLSGRDLSGQLEADMELIIPAKADATDGCNIYKKQICVVTGKEAYSPFSGEKLPDGGMVTEIVQKVFDGMGYKVTVEFQSWGVAKKQTKDGMYAASFPWLENADRKKSFYYSKPLYKLLIAPFFLKGEKPFNGGRSERYEHTPDQASLHGLRLCRPQSYYMHDLQDLIDSGKAKISRPATLENCFDQLLNKDVDVVPVSTLVGQYAIKSHPRFKDTIEAEDYGDILGSDGEGIHLIFSKISPPAELLRFEFNQVFDRMNETGQIMEIKQRHLKNYFKSID